MKCVICKTGDVRDGTTSVTLQRDETTIVIKQVPAQVCDQCGEYYLSDAMTQQVLAMGEEAIRKGADEERRSVRSCNTT